jgi:sulfite reductase (NADPH) hemoprotein beta-component
MAEIGIVGRAPNKYQLFVGGNEGCTRLNRLFKENVKGEDILNVLKPELARFAAERKAGERFGDWAHRTLFAEQPKAEAAAQPVGA